MSKLDEKIASYTKNAADLGLI